MAHVYAAKGGFLGSELLMSPRVDRSLTSDRALMNAIDAVIEDGAKSIMVLACSANKHNPYLLNPYLTSLKIPVFGGVFPALFIGAEYLEQGIIVLGFRCELHVECFQYLSEKSLNEDLAYMFFEGESIPGGMLVYTDAFSSAAEHFVNCFYESLGSGIPVIGGGAGSLDWVQRPCLFSNKGMLEDAALVIGLTVNMHTAMSTGWEILDGPYLITDAQDNIVKSIDFDPAFTHYQRTVERIAGVVVDADDFFSVSKNFPLGVVNMDGQVIVRDPVTTEDGELICVGAVPKNSLIYLLSGDPDKLVEAASEAAKKIQIKGDNDAVFVFDCISRMLFLDTQFKRELKGIQENISSDTLIIGALSLGEVANIGSGMVSVLNKTITLGAI